MVMIRKQIFIEEGQNQILKRLAKKTGKSEGALIREVIGRFLVSEEDADARWEAMIARWAQNPVTNKPRTWTRSDLYEDRVGKFHADSH